MDSTSSSSGDDTSRTSKRRKTSAWDAPPPVGSVGLGAPALPLSTGGLGLGLDPQRLDVIHKVAFFVARYGHHMEDMVRERRKSEPRLKWLIQKNGPEYHAFSARVRELRARLREIRSEGRSVWVETGEDHHITTATLCDKDKLAVLDAIYYRRERLRANGQPDPSAALANSVLPTTLPGGHHLQDFIPNHVMADFLARSTAVRSDSSSNAPEPDLLGSQLSVPSRAGLGTASGAPHEPQEGDDEFTLYKKRMMLAYRYRPNPLGNPRTPYY